MYKQRSTGIKSPAIGGLLIFFVLMLGISGCEAMEWLWWASALIIALSLLISACVFHSVITEYEYRIIGDELTLRICHRGKIHRETKLYLGVTGIKKGFFGRVMSLISKKSYFCFPFFGGTGNTVFLKASGFTAVIKPDAELLSLIERAN